MSAAIAGEKDRDPAGDARRTPGDAVAIGVDVGTTSVKAVAIDPAGRIVASAERSHPLHTPRPGWTEQEPDDWWRGAGEALREITGRLGERAIAAIGLTGQMHGLVTIDEDGDVVRPAILWNDQRTGDAVRQIEEAVPRRTLVERGGNPAVTGFQLPKLLWLRDAEPEAYGRIRQVMFPKDLLGFRLTGRVVTEPSDASGSNCFHLASKTWDGDVLDELGVDAGRFPEIVASDARVGGVTANAARHTGLREGTPVVAGAGDNAAAATALGLTSDHPEIGSVSLGTSGVIFAPLEEPTPDPDGRVHLFCHADGTYHLLGVTLAAAGSMQWLRDTLFADRSFADVVALAQHSPVGSRGVVFLPYLAGERTPHMDPDLRGAWRGLSLATERSDLVRAVLEGVAFSLRDALEVMRPLSRLERAIGTGGGARSDSWLQIVADVLGIPLTRPEDVPGAAFGAAALAWRAQGHEAVTGPPSGDAFDPSAERAEAFLAGWEAYRAAR